MFSTNRVTVSQVIGRGKIPFTLIPVIKKCEIFRMVVAVMCKNIKVHKAVLSKTVK